MHVWDTRAGSLVAVKLLCVACVCEQLRNVTGTAGAVQLQVALYGSGTVVQRLPKFGRHTLCAEMTGHMLSGPGWLPLNSSPCVSPLIWMQAPGHEACPLLVRRLLAPLHHALRTIKP